MALISIVIIFASLFVLRKSTHINEDVALRNKIVEITKQQDKIDFSQATAFEWDTLYIFPPYSKPEEVLKSDGVKTESSGFKIEYLDNINMIAFVKSNELVSFVELPRIYCEIGDNTKTKYRRTEARFNISQKNKAIVFNTEDETANTGNN